jgi:hypothetical protein
MPLELTPHEIRTALASRVAAADDTFRAAADAAGLPMSEDPDNYTIRKRLERMTRVVEACDALRFAWRQWAEWEQSIVSGKVK